MTPETIEKMIEEARGMIEANAKALVEQHPNKRGMRSFTLRFEYSERALTLRLNASQRHTDETQASLPDPNQEEMPL